jgi:pimeloyl-ACP methyl ester carboxylesterase
MAAALEPIFSRRPGWRRIYPDLPGMGRSPRADWIRTEDDVLEAVLEFADRVIGDRRLCVIGVSYGGYLARGLIHRRRTQLDGAMLWVPAMSLAADRPDVPEPQPVVVDPAAVATVEPDEEFWLRVAVVQTEPMLALFRERVRPGMLIADHEFLEPIAESGGFSFDPDALPEPMAAPALILAGRQDSNVGYRATVRILENFTRGTLAVLDRSGHRLAEEQPRTFEALVDDWLDRVEEHAPG